MADDKLVVRPEEYFKDQGKKRKKLQFNGRPDTSPASVTRFPGNGLITPELRGKPKFGESGGKKPKKRRRKHTARIKKPVRYVRLKPRRLRRPALEARVELLESYVASLLAFNRKMARSIRRVVKPKRSKR